MLSPGKIEDSAIVHVGVYDGAGKIMEAAGAAGVRSMRLDLKAPGMQYHVYRPANAKRADGAALWAENMILTRSMDESAQGGTLDSRGRDSKRDEGFGRYRLGTGGILRDSTRGPKAQEEVESIKADPWKDRSFFCSNFVLEMFELSAEEDEEPLLPLDHRNTSPKKMYGEVSKSANFSLVGVFTVPPQR